MATKENYEDHNWVVNALSEAQKADHDTREQSRECIEFVSHRQGQWEDFWYDASDGRPRYTFDMVNPHIDQVAGIIERSDFAINVEPASGSASMDIAEVYGGLIRNIQNISGAEHTYNRAGRRMITCGLDGWRVNTRYAEGDSFDQDLFIEKVPNFIDRVWFGPHEDPDASDADFCWLLTGYSEEEFKAKFPGKSSSNVTQDRTHNAYYHREDLVMVGEFFWLEPVERELVKLSNGKVFDAEAYAPLADEYAAAQITEVGRRTRTVKKLRTRLFSANEWLSETRETAFENWLSIVPVYGNFEVSNDKRVFWGVVEKLMDAQRVYNYAQSRQVEEAALAPRQKWLVTEEQIEGLEDEWDDLNTNANPYLPYKHVDGVPPPSQEGGAQINPGIKMITDDMANVIRASAGHFDATMGEDLNGQSGKAIEALQDRGDTGTNKYLEAMEIAMSHTARILIDTIPRVYLPNRQIRVVGEDGTRDFVTLGETKMDSQTQQEVVVIDLNTGTYDVVASAGPSYKNRQNETVSVLKELAVADPTIAEMGGDILAGNVSSPGMKDLAERKREQLFQANLIPLNQLTDEERARMEQMQSQPPAEDPNMVLAQAEVEKARADQAQVQLDAQKHSDEAALKNRELDIKEISLRIDEGELQIKAAEAGVELETKKAKARKDNADAEAQEIENFATTSGVAQILEAANASP